MKNFTDHRVHSAAYQFGRADLSLYIAREMAAERRVFIQPGGWLHNCARVRHAINREIHQQASGAVWSILKGIVLARSGVLT